MEPAETEENEIQHVWALSVCDISGIPLDVLSVCDNSDLPSGEFGNLLNMIMDSGAEEHVVLADWKSLGEPLLKLAQVRLRSAIGDMWTDGDCQGVRTHKGPKHTECLILIQ